MIKLSILMLSIFGLVVAQEPVSIGADPKCANTTVKPSPSNGKYYFNAANNTKPCIVAQLSAYISLGQGHYLTLDNGTVNANNTRCGNATVDPKLEILFDCGHSISFTMTHSNDSTYVKLINGSFDDNNQTVSFVNSTENFKTTQSGHYYKCNAEQHLGLHTTPTMLNVTLTISNFAYEAYRDVAGTDFYGVPEECSLDAQPVSDLVRVAVGICLIALVAIVLVAYFIGRRRWAQRSSYESV